jgi:LacI family transcriptional regulator
MRKASNVTQTHIAKILGLSTVTVSKALRNHPDISHATIQRVKKLADEMGYTPDLIARALSSRRSNIIGVVVPEIDHTFFAGVMKGIYSTAKENHFQIVLTVSHEDDQKEVENLQTLIAMRVDGILVSISQKTNHFEIYDLIKRKHVPLVFFDRAAPDPDFGRVVVDDRRAAAGAVAYAVGQGYRRIAHLAGPPGISIADARREGYRDGLRAAGLPMQPEWIISCGFAEEDGTRGFEGLMRLREPPDAVFAVNDPVAIGVFDAAGEMGLRIPEDIGVIGFSDNIISRYLSPPLTTVMQPAQDIGDAAVRLVLEAVQKPEKYVPREIVIPTRLVIRDSCSRKKAKIDSPSKPGPAQKR